MKVNERRTVVGGWLATVCPPTVERDRRLCLFGSKVERKA